MAPCAFGSQGLYGGGERYPLELARAIAAEEECELVTFGPRPARWTDGGLRVRVLRPLGRLGGHPAQPVAPQLPATLAGADVVHTHHFRSLPTRMAALTARTLGAATAVTDHGLPGRTWGGLVHRLFDRYLTVSRFSAGLLGAPPARTQVVYGGADTRRFTPGQGGDRDGVLQVRAPGLQHVGELVQAGNLEVAVAALDPNPHADCRRCPFKPICPMWPQGEDFLAPAHPASELRVTASRSSAAAWSSWARSSRWIITRPSPLSSATQGRITGSEYGANRRTTKCATVNKAR